jgi:ABC-type hemin transport system ATPase subunit
VVAIGSPAEVLTPETLERTYGASMDVLVHHGVCIVVDRPHSVAPLHLHPVPVSGLAFAHAGRTCRR